MLTGSAVTYTDQHGAQHPALCTIAHGAETDTFKPSINVVYVSTDEEEKDQYGRQIKRETSVVHRMHQSAGGRFWE